MNHREKFLSYASAYDRSNGMIELKIVHTLRVAEVMNALTKALGDSVISEELCKLAEFCAIYHDIGRFEQVRIYGTFNDSKSCNHAEMSCKVLQEGDFLEDLTPHEREMVLTAIANHNRFEIEDGLDEETLLLAKLIRDADKCDIFRVFAKEDMVDTMGETIAQVEREIVTDEVYECFLRHECIERKIRRTGLDIWIGFLGFFFDMNFPESMALARRERFYLEPFEAAKFENPETRYRVTAILAELEKYLAAHAGDETMNRGS